MHPIDTIVHEAGRHFRFRSANISSPEEELPV
jgi:hypothetical protein